MRFAKGIERDLTPVQAALQLPDSNGVIEGHVHRTLFVKVFNGDPDIIKFLTMRPCNARRIDR